MANSKPKEPQITNNNDQNYSLILSNSKLFSNAKKVTPSGVNSPVRYFEPYPFFTKKANGAYIWDADNRKLIDFCNGYGALLLGHRRKEIINSVSKQLTKGTLYCTPTEGETELAKLIIGNLQSTPLAKLAALNIHTMCDDLIRGLMAKLDIPIPEWELHRRIRVTIHDQMIKIIGLDLHQDIDYTLFSAIRIIVRQGTEGKYDSKMIRDIQPDGYKLKILNPNTKMDVYVQLNWQGHYNEPMYTIKLPLTNLEKEIHLFYNPKTGSWREQ